MRTALKIHRSSPSSTFFVFKTVLEERLTIDGARWLDESSTALNDNHDAEHFCRLFSLAARQVGRSEIVLNPGEWARLEAVGLSWELSSRVDEWTRVLLLLIGYESGVYEMPQIVESLFLNGDLHERRAVLRSLPLLPDREAFVPLAQEACRTNIEPLFTAISCENPYPAAYFHDAAFHQMVLKALYLGIPVKRIIGLEERRSPELRRMALDLVSERRAAGRSIPGDLCDVLDAGVHRDGT